MAWVHVVLIEVIGTPRPGGSKSYVGHTKETPFKKSRALLIDSSKYGPTWRADIQAVAMRKEVEMIPKPVAIKVQCEFYRARPKSHFRTGKNAKLLLKGAPDYPTTLPDLTKYWRAAEDALTNIFWKDDSQIVEQRLSKLFALPGERERMTLHVWRWEE